MMTRRWTCVSTLGVLLLWGNLAPVGAQTVFVPAGGNLQDALNTAPPGATILLQEGAEFVGNFVLPVKTGDAGITVRSSAPDTVLPDAGTRIRPSDAPHLARLRSPNALAALKTAAGSHHWALRYLEFGANQNGIGDILQLGDGSSAQNSLSLVPHHLTLQHVFVHGDALQGQKRCVALNAAHVTISDSHISDCKGVGQDTQAIGGWNGPGPFTIENNYLEGAGENVMFGGADPAIPNLVSSGITFRRNYVARPLSWRNPIIGTPQGAAASAESGGALAAGVYAYRVVARGPVGSGNIGRSTASVETTATAAVGGSAVRVSWNAVPGATEYRVYGRTGGAQAMYWRVTTTQFLDTGTAGTSEAVPTSAGTVWTVKNLFELKNASDVVVEENIFENHWKEAQPGFAIVLTPRNSSGGCPWCVVERVRFEWNLVRNVAAGINLIGFDGAATPTRQTNDIAFRQNLFTGVSSTLGGNAWFMQIGGGPRDLAVEHNTIDTDGGSLIYVYGGTSTDPLEVYGLRMIANAARHSFYGMNGAFFTYGNAILANYYPDNVFQANYLAGGLASRYPVGTLVSGTLTNQFADAAAGDYSVVSGSILRNAAPDGSHIGVDYPALAERLEGVMTGEPSGGNPPPPPPVPPTAALTVTCTYLACAYADASTPGSGTITTRSWAFGDGTTGNAASGTHTYSAGGTYTVTLTVTDSNGLSDTESTTATAIASPAPPMAALTVTCTNLACAYADASTPGTGTIVTRSWAFGDGTTGGGASGTHTYSAAGTYTVTLTVTDSNSLSDSESTTVTAVAPSGNVAPTARFDSSCVDLTCTFIDQSTDSDGVIVSRAWTFGSAGTSSAASPSFRFPAPGTYSISLTVTDDDGASATATSPVDVRAVIHAALTDARTETGGGRTPSWWKASVMAAVHGADERPIAGATITAAWSGGWSKVVTCISDATGRCTFKTNPMTMDKTSVTFTVTAVSAPLSVHTATANHNNTGSGTSSSVTVIRP